MDEGETGVKGGGNKDKRKKKPVPQKKKKKENPQNRVTLLPQEKAIRYSTGKL